MTEGLKCVDSRPGGISQGLERGKRGFLPSIAMFIKLESVILITKNRTAIRLAECHPMYL